MNELIKINKYVCVAPHNRYKCTCCGNKIIKGEHFYRKTVVSYSDSNTTNICKDCIATISVIIGITQKELNNKRKELIVEGLE